MAAKDNINKQQFQHVMLPDVGKSGTSVHLSLPAPQKEHTRLYRFTNGVGRGSYSKTPLTGYGYSMHYVDIPSSDLPNHEVNESGSVHYRYGGAGIKTVNPFIHPTAKTKDYELTDWQHPDVIK
jgi:hypothetical protein